MQRNRHRVRHYVQEPTSQITPALDKTLNLTPAKPWECESWRRRRFKLVVADAASGERVTGVLDPGGAPSSCAAVIYDSAADQRHQGWRMHLGRYRRSSRRTLGDGVILRTSSRTWQLLVRWRRPSPQMGRAVRGGGDLSTEALLGRVQLVPIRSGRRPEPMHCRRGRRR